MKLEIGYNQPPEVRSYRYTFGPLAGKRILYLSDLHYHRWSRQRVDRHIRMIQEIHPDILLLGGDYVDTPFGLPCFRELVGSIGMAIPAFAIAGNHDRPYLRRIREIVVGAGVTWLHNECTLLRLGRQAIRIEGTRPVEVKGPADPPAPFSILCLHQPIDVRPIAHRYNLIFAGHLHGGQIVFWQNSQGLYPVRWRYRWNQLSLEYGQCHYLISKGLGDTIPIRLDCARDVIVVTLEIPTLS